MMDNLERTLKRAKPGLEEFSEKNRTDDGFEDLQDAWLLGYIRCEKDCALTWEDVELICDFKEELMYDDNLPPRSKELYEEVLRRFNEVKEKEK